MNESGNHGPPLLWRFPKSWNPYNVKSFLTDISLSVAQIKKFQKTRWFYFLILLLGGPSPPSQLVPNPFNWSPNTVFYRYLCIGRSNQKISKTRWFYFWILLLGGPSPPSQLVPNPFNWSPNTFFYRYLAIGRSNQKISKNKVHFFTHKKTLKRLVKINCFRK